MKILVGIFLSLLAAIPQHCLEALQLKPEMIVVEPTPEKVPKGTWRSLPIGSYARSKSTTVQFISGAKTTHIAYTKQTLVALSDKKAVLEMESHVEGSLVKNQIDIPFDSDLPPKELTSPPVGSASGAESVAIGLKSVACKWVESIKALPLGRSIVKTWYSAEIPGYVARMVIKQTTPSLTIEATIQVIDFKGN
jgi:hypothetical protein